MRRTIGAKRAQRIMPGAAQHHEIRPERESAQDVQPALDTVVRQFELRFL